MIVGNVQLTFDQNVPEIPENYQMVQSDAAGGKLSVQPHKEKEEENFMSVCVSESH